ncbi:hypothetical protein [Nitratireductor sp. XY-223]|uniref:hypothetical protein n=1 Tax=Nitratireductor sp. XY-223 TaxID=2561926 RepID=UPI0010A9C40D|nr:hypothetical protein [Nitratireductor sp. XY-223]
MRSLGSAAALPLLAGLLSACQTGGPGPGGVTVKSSDSALPAMERIAVSASNCWFKSGDRGFRAYRLAPELNSFSGRPRILIVPANRPQDRPLAVVEGQGSPATISAYGPLMSDPVGNRIAADVRRWSGGAKSCSS